MDHSIVQAAYEEHGAALYRYLFAMLRDTSAADDALHEAFETFIEKGDSVSKDSIRAWLFRVAYQKAMLVKRKSAMRQRHHEKIAWQLDGSGAPGALAGGGNRSVSAPDELIKREDIDRLRAALDTLKPEQRQIVQMRIHEGLKFREISESLGIPLGTVLTRMRSSLQKLKNQLEAGKQDTVED